MEPITDNDRLNNIKDNIQNAYQYWQSQYKLFNEFKTFVFKSSLNTADILVLEELDKPAIEFNFIEAFYSRLLGEFSKQEPSIVIEADEVDTIDPEMLKAIEGHCLHLLREADGRNQFSYKNYHNLLCGFTVAKIWTEYASELSFHQNIRVGLAFDPTLCGFDPMAREPDKSDGAFCYELFPKRKIEFQKEFPEVDISAIQYMRAFDKFNWSYSNQREDILLLAHYYEKKRKRKKIVYLSNGKTLLKEDYNRYIEQWTAAGHTEQPAIIIRERMTEIEVITRTTLIENQILEEVDTTFKTFPLKFAAGNSVLIAEENDSTVYELCRPYGYQAKGIQKLKNLAGQSLANDLENMVMHKFKVALESIPKQYTEAYTNIQKMNTLVYRAFKEDNPDQPIPPPTEIARVGAPPEVMNTFATCEQTAQAILGSYDAALGINDNQLSGVALIEGATQSNAAAMPYIVSYLQLLTSVFQEVVEQIPNYYVLPRTIPVAKYTGEVAHRKINTKDGYVFDYTSGALKVKCKAGVNFGIQKSRSLQQLFAVCQSMPMIAQYVQSQHADVVFDNMDMRGVEQLKAGWKAWSQQMQQQGAQQNPQAMAAQVKMQEVQAKTQIEQQKLQLEAQKSMSENQFRARDQELESQQIMNETMRIHLEAAEAHDAHVVALSKAATEREVHAMDLGLKQHDMRHRHTKEAIELHATLSKPEAPQESAQ